jgi:hypothetical protein
LREVDLHDTHVNSLLYDEIERQDSEPKKSGSNEVKIKTSDGSKVKAEFYGFSFDNRVMEIVLERKQSDDSGVQLVVSPMLLRYSENMESYQKAEVVSKAKVYL